MPCYVMRGNGMLRSPQGGRDGSWMATQPEIVAAIEGELTQSGY